MKILITGCRGQLGTELQKQLAAGESELGRLPEAVQQAEVAAVDMDVLDISDLAATKAFVGREKPDVIINCAAYTNVDG